jgi:hypothetical protein
MDSERCPLHVQSNLSGMIAQEAGRPKSVAQLFREHCPTPPPPSTAAASPVPAQAQSDIAAAPADATAAAAALLSSLSLIDPAAEAIPYD